MIFAEDLEGFVLLSFRPVRVPSLPKGHPLIAAIPVAKHRVVDTSLLSLRDLVGEGFPLHEDDIPELLELIGDFEQDVMEIIMVTVGNAM